MNFDGGGDDDFLGLSESNSENEDGAQDVAMPPAPAPEPSTPPTTRPSAVPWISKRGITPLQGPWLMQGFTNVLPKLYVDQTKLRDNKGQRLDQLGVFCHTRIRAGDFICAFTGSFMAKERFDRKAAGHKAMRRHAVQLDFNKIGDKTEESQMLYAMPDEDSVSFGRVHVAQCLNEPQKGTRANVVFFQHQYVKDVEKDEYYTAILVYAAHPIAAHSEIHLHYGEGYAAERARNKYEAGDPAVWDESLVRRPSMDEVVEAILANGERIDEILYKEGQGDEQEVFSSVGSRRRGNQQVERFGF